MIKKFKSSIFFLIFSTTLTLHSDILTLYRKHELDNRKVKNQSSPKFLNAIGSLGYINNKHKIRSKRFLNIECGANLISLKKKQDSNLIITVSHCVSDKIKNYTWTSTTNSGNKIVRQGKLLFNDKKNDIALIKLNKTILYQNIQPLLILNYNLNFNEKNFIVGGFSVDHLGNYGQQLTYDSKPNFVKIGNKKENIGEIGSIVYQGDSGGAIIYNDVNTDTQYIVGIMSFISKNQNLFKNEVGKFGNISGYFVDFVSYKSVYDIILSFIPKKIF